MGTQLTLVDRAVQKLMANPPETNQASLEQSLTALLGAMPEKELGQRTDPEYGATFYVKSFKLPDSITYEQASQALKMVSLAMEPLPAKEMARELSALRSACATRSNAEDIAWASSVYAERLADWPADAVMYALRRWPEKSKWWPTWKDLQDLLEEACADRKVLLRALETRVNRGDDYIELDFLPRLTDAIS